MMFNCQPKRDPGLACSRLVDLMPTGAEIRKQVESIMQSKGADTVANLKDYIVRVRRNAFRSGYDECRRAKL